MTTHNTEHDAAIAREAAIRLHENSYIRNGIAGPNAFIHEVTRAILEAASKIGALRAGKGDADRLKFLTDLFLGCKWADIGPISHLRGDEKYIQSNSIERAIDAAIAAGERGAGGGEL